MGHRSLGFDQSCRITQGEDCTICLDDWPDRGRPRSKLKSKVRINVIETGAPAAGLCQNHWPRTDPKSIIVIPKFVAREIRWSWFLPSGTNSTSL